MSTSELCWKKKSGAKCQEPSSFKSSPKRSTYRAVSADSKYYISLKVKNVPLYFDKARFLSNKKYDSCKCWTCTEFSEAFNFLMENIYMYVQFDGMVYQQIVEIPMGTNSAPLIADLFLYCYARDFMSNLQKF